MKFKFKIDKIKRLYVLAAAIFLTGLGLLIWFGRASQIEQSAVESVIDASEAKPCPYRRRLDGICVESALGVDPELAAVMIENSREAWPLAGLASARVVYETPVEGNVPRFLAIYAAGDEVKKVGPVRSARPYYLDWVSEYGNTMYMHVGGSDEALEKIDAANVFDLNEFYRGQYFWRSDDRPRPHNTYTSSVLWQKARKDYGKYYETEAYDSWVFDEREPCQADCAAEVTVAFLSPTYDARWVFNSSTQQYARYQNKQVQQDADGVSITADTVIVQRVKSATIDEIGRKKIDTIGSGEALVFRDGYLIEGRWEKASRKDRTQFYDEKGGIISFKAGKIWIEVAPLNVRVETGN